MITDLSKTTNSFALKSLPKCLSLKQCSRAIVFPVMLSTANIALADDVSSDISIDSYTLTSSTYISQNNYLLIYTVSATSSATLSGVVGSVDSAPPAIISYVDSSLDFGDLASGASGNDTIEFYARRSPLANTSRFSWTFDGSTGTTDTDGDGYADDIDAFPNDASEWADTDADGVGDNSDAFPNDPSETTDSDGDGTGDNSDPCPNDATDSCGGEVTLTYSIVDTNQNSCYPTTDTTTTVACGAAGAGQDGAYDGNTPSYTTSTSGKSVYDNVTELTWTQSTDIDDSGAVDYGDKLGQSDAVSYCANLTVDGISNWRLPNIKEGYSLILFSGRDASSAMAEFNEDSYSQSEYDAITATMVLFQDSAFDEAFGDMVTASGISAGDRIIDAQYASSTEYVYQTMGGDDTMFGVNYVDGRIKGYPLSSSMKKYYVRCVSGNTSYSVNDFVDNGDSTISDNATGLMWQQNDFQSNDWQDAIDSCEASTTANHSDWRLPNVKELQSIVDYTRSPDTTSSAAIDAKFNATSFSNEEGYTDWGSYWASTTHVDYYDDGGNATNVSFGRALGYMSNFSEFLDVHGAGAQRSDDKDDVSTEMAASSGTDNNNQAFYYKGPQGDILRHDNMARCVRDN